VVASRLAWLGPTRTQAQRSAARALSSGRLRAAAPVIDEPVSKRPARRQKGGHR